MTWPGRWPLFRANGITVEDNRIPNGYLLAKDSSFVVTIRDGNRGTPRDGNEEHLVECWDVPQPKPWAWIVGTPPLLGAALLGLRAWWRSRRKRDDDPMTGS